MDKYAPKLLDLGLGAMIGKGKRSQAVIDAIVRNGSVYFAAIGARYKSRAELTGGVILILIGLKILLEHLGVIAF